MIISLISSYSIKLYIDNKKHEENEYVLGNDIYYVSEDKGNIISELNILLQDRTAEIEALKENNINEIVVCDNFKLIRGEGNEIFKVIYTVSKFQQRFSVLGKRVDESYKFIFYSDY